MDIALETAEDEIEIKKSRFIANLHRISREEDLKEAVKALRIRYPGCSHVVYAFVLGADAAIFGYSDDREPRGTAGRPIHEVLKGSGLTNCAVTVVRYFGGTKLGTGGLVRAYTLAARTVLENIKRGPLRSWVPFSLVFAYEYFDNVKHCTVEQEGRIETEEFSDRVHVGGNIPEERFFDWSNNIRDICRGKLELESGEAHVF